MFEIVSAIVINHNRKYDLEECVASIKAQSHSTIELIVLDNDSSDIPSHVNIRLPVNMGVTIPTNIGVASSVGKFILLVDNDAILDREFVKNAVYIMNQHADIGVVASRVYKHGTTEDFDYESYGTDIPPDVPHYTGTFCGTACLIRREAWDQVKGYNLDYFAYYQEPDFAARIMKRGWKIYYSPDCICWHKFSPVARSSATMVFFLTRNHYLFVWEHLPLFWALFQTGKWMVWSIVKGWRHPWTLARAYFWTAVMLPRALWHRKVLKDPLFVYPWKQLLRSKRQ